MRISIDKYDAGYRPDANRFDVQLDGQPCEGVVTADDEQGIVTCWAFGPTGSRRADVNGPMGYKVEHRHGVVQIIKTR